MSKHRHGLPRKKPDSPKQADIDAELPVLEAVGDGSQDASQKDGPVRITCTAGKNGIDTVLTIALPKMAKDEVPAAIAGPLQRAVQTHAANVRLQAVAVTFAGESLIGSAIKDQVKTTLLTQKPIKIVVQRGFGDEVVHDVPAPKLTVTTEQKGPITEITVGTGELESFDLPRLFAPVLADIAGKAKGKKITLQFTGEAKPDSDLRDQVATALREAGAVRAALGARVLFDRELLDRVKVTDGADTVAVVIDAAADPAITGEAMETVLPEHALGFAGRIVRVKWRTAPAHGEGDHFLRIVTKFAPEHIEFQTGDGESVVMWPALIDVTPGPEVVVRVRPNGRSHTAVLAAFPRECADFGKVLAGKAVVVDWPKLFVIDDDTERCLLDTMAKVSPKSVCCTVAGDQREPFLPPPITLADEKSGCTLRVSTDAGRPADLVRGIERSMPRFGKRLVGKSVRVQVTGAAPASRTMLRAILDPVEAARPTRIELEDHGKVDVLRPALLKVTRSGAKEARIDVDLGGRDEAQRDLALKREIDEVALPKHAIVTITRSALDAPLLAALIKHGADLVSHDDGTQIYPEPLPEPEPEPVPEPVVAAKPVVVPAVAIARSAAASAPGSAPGSALGSTGAAMAALRVLAVNNDAVPPTLLLGVDVGDDAPHVANVEQQLLAHLPRFQRRCVMVVLQQNGKDVPVRREDGMVAMLRRVLPQGAAATMVFRGPDAQGRPHFQVLHSSLRALPIGATFLDPRPPS